MRKKILVTGGAGFVGSYLSRELLKNNSDVVIVDDLSNGKESNIPTGAKFFKSNLAHNETYDKLKDENFYAIYHLAAQASNAISFRDPYNDLNSNQLATLKLLEFARRADCKRVLFTSSMSAYGTVDKFPTPETTALNSDSPYGAHKAASERYLKIYEKEYGFRGTVFRLYTTYGGGQNLDNIDQGLLSIYLAYLIKNIPIVVKGSLERTRDIVHVSDVVWALMAALENQNSFGKIYNLCSGTSMTIREILDDLISEMGLDPKTYKVEVLAGTPGDPQHTHGSYLAAKEDLGFMPKILPRDGIKMTVAAYRAKL